MNKCAHDPLLELCPICARAIRAESLARRAGEALVEEIAEGESGAGLINSMQVLRDLRAAGILDEGRGEGDD